MTESSNGNGRSLGWVPTEGCAPAAEESPEPAPSSAQSAASGQSRGSEEALILTLQQVESLMTHAVKLSALIGPEWENVVSSIQGTLLESLLELEKRLRPRLLPVGSELEPPNQSPPPASPTEGNQRRNEQTQGETR